MSLTLRHTLATVAYRGRKAIRNAPPEFSTFAAAEGSRTAGEILAHICDLYDWALHMSQGRQLWAPKAPQSWEADSARFFASLATLDTALASPFPGSEEHLFQGPIADSLTHVGQINFLRRLAGSPVKGENYAKADIVTGRVGDTQTKPKSEF